jgi:hypothetical protein
MAYHPRKTIFFRVKPVQKRILWNLETFQFQTGFRLTRVVQDKKKILNSIYDISHK